MKYTGFQPSSRKSAGNNMEQLEKSFVKSPVVNTPLYIKGGWGFVSGITGRIGERLVDGGFEEEFRCIMSKLQDLLASEGLDLNDLVKVNIYLSDMNNRSRLNELYLGYFKDHLPARTVVGVTEIARKGSVELEGIVDVSRTAG
ncbi:RidA family protein [Erwinia sp. D4-22]